VGGRTKWQELEHTVALAIRFLDNVIDVNKYRLEANKRTATNGRRIGLGVMGLAEYLFAKEVRYGSKAALGETADVLKVIRDQAYRTSVELAKEKGAFPAYDKIQYHKASFVRKLPTAIRRSITDNGIRNVTLLALAPTGTISLIPEVTGGIEPLFAKAYVRRDRVSTRTYVHPTLSGCFKVGHEVPSYVVDVSDLTPVDHLEMQSVCQRYVDGAVSKTINVPSTFTAEDLSPILFEYLYDIKGVTVYRDGSRSGQVLTTITNDEARKYVQDNDVVVESAVTDVESTGCATGACEL
jgi:ribonucleoside-diphosphate reductase alpha chain